MSTAGEGGGQTGDPHNAWGSPKMSAHPRAIAQRTLDHSAGLACSFEDHVDKDACLLGVDLEEGVGQGSESDAVDDVRHGVGAVSQGQCGERLFSADHGCTLDTILSALLLHHSYPCLPAILGCTFSSVSPPPPPPPPAATPHTSPGGGMITQAAVIHSYG
jgi:hypothetical protein